MLRAAVLATLLAVLPLLAFQNDGPYPIGSGVSAPVLLEKVEPNYTDEAREAKIQGPVVVSTEIDVDGRARNMRVVRSLDPGLDANAVAAIEQWIFKPGEKDGRPVRVVATIEVNFKLQ
jgi:periplasmic protein TonB